MWSKNLEILNPYEALMEKAKEQSNICNKPSITIYLKNIISYFKNLFKKGNKNGGIFQFHHSTMSNFNYNLSID